MSGHPVSEGDRAEAAQFKQELPGHSSVAVTGAVYGHVSPDVSREALATLGASLLAEWWPVKVVKPSAGHERGGPGSLRNRL